MEIQFLTEINTNKTIQKWGISCVENADVPHYVVSAYAKEKNSKKIEKTVDFSAQICYYNTRLERKGKTY